MTPRPVQADDVVQELEAKPAFTSVGDDPAYTFDFRKVAWFLRKKLDGHCDCGLSPSAAHTPAYTADLHAQMNAIAPALFYRFSNPNFMSLAPEQGKK